MIKLKDLLLERDINEPEFMKILNAAKKANMNLYKKVVKALKDIPVRASIHLDVDGDLSINLGMYYFEKKNPEGTGDLSDMVEDRLKKAGIQKGYNSPPGVSIQASTSHLDDDRYTKAQHDIRGGVD